MVDVFQIETDVLIVGAGPTGLATALALTTYGIRCHVISKWNWLAHTPRAHITNQRAMEVFRDLGVEGEMLQLATPWEHMGDMPLMTSLAGEEFARLRSWGTGDSRKGEYLKVSPCRPVDLIQPKVETVLHRNAAHRGAIFSFNTELIELDQDEQGVTALCRDNIGERQYTIRAKYLVGADGANSKVVEQIGLPIEGRMARAGTIYVNFEADLARFVEHRPSILNFVISPKTSYGDLGMGLLRAVTPWNRWIAGWGIDITKGQPNLAKEFLREQISSMIGDPSVAFQIKDVSVWYVNQAYATEYSRGRVLCAGDAVHRHPPSNGLGLNTCVQDAHNLAWKIAYVLHGFAGPDLIQTYSQERAPAGQKVVERANQSRLEYAPLHAAMRVSDAENPVLDGLKRLRDPGPEGKIARSAFYKALRLKDREFNALGMECNQRYASGAVIPDGSTEELFERDPVLFAYPTTKPGSKLPHAWLVNQAGMRISTLDVVGKGRFVLITGLSGHAWAAAVDRLRLPFLDCVVVGTPAFQDLDGDWNALREVEEDGAILVRPDGYVCWRHIEGGLTFDEAERLIKDAITFIISFRNKDFKGSQDVEMRKALQYNFGMGVYE